jgi:hypothetical protein
LAEYYAKNPNDEITPECATQLISNDILETHQKLQSHTVSSLINSYNSNLRYNKKPNLKNNTNVEENRISINQKNDKKINNYGPNTSLNRQSRINGAKILTSNNIQKCVDFKIKHNKIRSLSENNFRQSEDEDDNEENEFIITSKKEINDELSKGIEDKLLNEKRELVAKLEKQNKEILKEIKKLKLKQLSNKSLDQIDTRSEFNIEIGKQNQKNLTYNNHLGHKAHQSSTLDCKNLTSNYMTTPKKKAQMNPHLVAAELKNLKKRKGLLENRMQILESSRDELIDRLTQLDTLLRPESFKTMKSQAEVSNPSTKILGNLQSQNNLVLPVTTIQKITHSPPLIITTTSSSSTYIPALSSSIDMMIPNTINDQEIISKKQQTLEQNSQKIMKNKLRCLSQPATLGLHDSFSNIEHDSSIKTNINNNNSSLSIIDNENLKKEEMDLSNKNISNNNFNGSTSNLRTLRNDLFIAADSVTNAMQSLVNELNLDDHLYKISNNYSDKNNEQDQELILNDNFDNFNLENLNFSDNIGNLNKNRYITSHSLSASSTPVIYRKNINFYKLKNLNSNYTGDELKNNLDIKNKYEMNSEIYENDNIELNDTNIIISKLNNVNDSRIIFMNQTFDDKLYSADNKEEILEKTLDNFSNTNKINVKKNSKLLENNLIDNEEFNDEDDSIFQEYVLFDNFVETYDQNHQAIDEYLNEGVLSIFPKCLDLPDKQESCDLVSNEIDELNNQLNLANNDQVSIWRKELEQRLINNNNSNNYTSEDNLKQAK